MAVLFSSFDLFPSHKGAGTHIAQNLATLKKIFGSVYLLALGSGAMPRYQEEEGITIRRHVPPVGNYLERTEFFGRFVSDAVERMERVPRICHFRDIWSGIPLLAQDRIRGSLKVFEVNGLPSIELPYHYPEMLKKRGLMSRLRSMEDFCLERSDSIITISDVTRNFLISRGAEPGKIHVIRNASYSPDGEMDPEQTLPAGGDHDEVDDEVWAAGSGRCRESGRPPGKGGEGEYILYTGTLTPWQGLPVLLKAFSFIRKRTGLTLFLACSTDKYLGQVKKMMRKMDLAEGVCIQTGLGRGVLWRLYREALFSVAPLTACARNIVQGCSPLKIIESMAAGTPVIASRIPVCSEIMDDRKEGMLVTPGSPRALAHAMELLWRDRDLLEKLRDGARRRGVNGFSMSAWGERLNDIYDTITGRFMKRYE